MGGGREMEDDERQIEESRRQFITDNRHKYFIEFNKTGYTARVPLAESESPKDGRITDTVIVTRRRI